MILGAHVSTAGGIYNAPLNAHELGIIAFQIFTKNQNRWHAKPLSEKDIEQYLMYCLKYNIRYTVAHDSYLINLCAIDDVKLAKSRSAFIDEFDRADQLQIDYLVMHPGSHMKAGEAAGIKLIAESIRICFDQRPNAKIRILFETTAGQGTNLGYKFEQIAELIHLVDCDDRIGVCLDTCHIFAAGYDFRTMDGYNALLDEFNGIIGLDRLYAFHINDSKKELGSRVDRHADIGDGFIGRNSFAFFVNDPRFEGIPAILETPGEIEDFARNLSILRELTDGENR